MANSISVKFVSHTPNGFDDFGRGSVCFDFGSEPIDMRIDGVLVTAMLVTPHGFKELGTAENLLWVLRHKSEKLKFGDGKF